MAKWAVFTIGLITATATADMVSLIATQQKVSVVALFGRGELFMVSIGLLMAASADLVFDRMLKRDMAVYHGVVLGACSLMILPAAVAYGSAKATEVGLVGQAVAASLAERRAEMSLWTLLGAVVLSGVGVFLSEAGGRRGTA